MGKRCVYCKQTIGDDRSVDVCDRCGVGVWGEKMFNAIKQNMDSAREKGNLHQGSICADIQGHVKDCGKNGAFKLIDQNS